MRAAGIEAFEHESARAPDRGINVALYTPAALATTRPTFTQEWLCETRPDSVSYYEAGSRAVRVFPRGSFTADGVLPTPAA